MVFHLCKVYKYNLDWIGGYHLIVLNMVVKRLDIVYTDRFFYVKLINIHWIVLVGMGRVRLVVGGRRKICF